MVCVKVPRRERDWCAWEQKDDQWSWPFWPYQEFGFYFKWAGSYWGATKSGLLFSLSLAFLGTKMLDHFLTGISFTLDHRFSFLKLRVQSLTFSCWLGLSIHYSLVLSSTGRTEAFEQDHWAFTIQFLSSSSTTKSHSHSGCPSFLIGNNFSYDRWAMHYAASSMQSNAQILWQLLLPKGYFHH